MLEWLAKMPICVCLTDLNEDKAWRGNAALAEPGANSQDMFARTVCLEAAKDMLGASYFVSNDGYSDDAPLPQASRISRAGGNRPRLTGAVGLPLLGFQDHDISGF